MEWLSPGIINQHLPAERHSQVAASFSSLMAPSRQLALHSDQQLSVPSVCSSSTKLMAQSQFYSSCLLSRFIEPQQLALLCNQMKALTPSLCLICDQFQLPSTLSCLSLQTHASWAFLLQLRLSLSRISAFWAALPSCLVSLSQQFVLVSHFLSEEQTTP